MKFSELPKKTERARELKVENGVIESVTITNDEHGCLTAWLNLNFNGGGCGMGGFHLGRGQGGNLEDDPGKSYCAEWISRCIVSLTDTGYGTWEGLKGKPIRALSEGLGGGIVAVGHFFQDKWFCPRMEFEKK